MSLPVPLKLFLQYFLELGDAKKPLIKYKKSSFSGKYLLILISSQSAAPVVNSFSRSLKQTLRWDRIFKYFTTKTLSIFNVIYLRTAGYEKKYPYLTNVCDK